MHVVVTSLRRFVWMMLLAAVGGALYAYWRDREGDDGLAPPEWPPLEPQSATTATTSATAPTTSATAPTATGSTTATTAAPAATDAWVAPLDGGLCPPGYPIKANDKSGIFHVPGGRFYERTRPERCYPSPEAAAADGYRQSKS